MVRGTPCRFGWFWPQIQDRMQIILMLLLTVVIMRPQEWTAPFAYGLHLDSHPHCRWQICVSNCHSGDSSSILWFMRFVWGSDFAPKDLPLLIHYVTTNNNIEKVDTISWIQVSLREFSFYSCLEESHSTCGEKGRLLLQVLGVCQGSNLEVHYLRDKMTEGARLGELELEVTGRVSGI